MSSDDDQFVVQRNMERFKRLLASEKDANKRGTLMQLLREEKAKQIDLPSGNTCSHGS